MNDSNEKGIKRIKEELLGFRAQALCIKTNVQILEELWNLQGCFKEKNAGAFYQTVQENCIFRIVLETFKMLYDKTSNNTILNMAKGVYNEMIGMDEFKDRAQELKDKRKEFSSKIDSYNEVARVITNDRKKVYAHNDSEFHWFSQQHIDNWELNDDIYNSILEISETCINYCNDLLAELGEKRIYGYSNYDDVKRLFGMKTEREEIRELLYGHKEKTQK